MTSNSEKFSQFAGACGGGGSRDAAERAKEENERQVEEITKNQKDIKKNQDKIIRKLEAAERKANEKPPNPRIQRQLDNDLSSRTTLEIGFALCEGHIAGFPSGDPERDIYINETPIKNADGSKNFQKVRIIDFRHGDATQAASTAYAGGIEFDTDVDQPVSASVGAVVRSISDVSVDAVTVRLMVPQLFWVVQKDDEVYNMSNYEVGTVVGWSVDFKIEVKSESTGWVTAVNDVIHGKSTTPFERQYTFNIPPGITRDIRVTRVSPDNLLDTRANDLNWQSYTSIIRANLKYPYTATLALELDAEEFQSAPRFGLRLKGFDQIKIPHNYDPVNRTYTGFFNGSLVNGWTNNPAWIFYDLCTNKRYGVGERIDASAIDVFSLYEIGKYCDESVPDGLGGFEPRFVCNVYIQSRDEAIRLIDAIASCFRGMSYYAAGSVFVTQDKPKPQLRLYTEANVVQEVDESGRITEPPFTYQGSAIEARHTVALVTWRDPKDFNRVKTEYIEDREGIVRYGYNPIDIVGFGCTSRGQAFRTGRWILLSEKTLTDTVTFTVGIEGELVNPGEVFKVADPLRGGTAVVGGRVKTGTTTTITLDRSVSIVGGNTYFLSIVDTSGNQHTRVVATGVGSHTALTVTAPFPTVPAFQSVWILESTAVQAAVYSCVAVSELENGNFEITGLEYNETLFNAVDFETKVSERAISGIPRFTNNPQPPEALTIRETLYTAIGSGGLKNKVDVSWKPSPSPYIKEYHLEWQAAFEFEWRTLQRGNLFVAELPDVPANTYTFRVQAINILGLRSVYLMETVTLFGLNKPPTDVTNFTLTPMSGIVLAQWDLSPDIDVLNGGHFKIKFTSKTSGFSWIDGVDLGRAAGSATSIQLPLINGAYMIKAVDTASHQSNGTAQAILANYNETLAFDAITSTTQNPTFPGTFVNTAVVDNRLRLVTGEYFDQQAGLFDSAPGNFDEFSGYFDSTTGLFDATPGLFEDLQITYGVVPSGSYEFNAPIDLGEVFVNRLVATLSAVAVDETQLFERNAGLFDDRTGLFDGTDIDDAFATLQIATSMDAVLYGAWENFTVGEYIARAFKFRVLLNAGSPNHNVLISELGVTIDMPERLESGEATTSTSAHQQVNFGNKFRIIPNVGITVNNGVSGDYIEFGTKDAIGFEISVRDSTNARVARSITYIAKGVGKVLV